MIKQFVELIQSECLHSISHRHESNGYIEHVNKEVVRHLRAITSELRNTVEWSKYIMLVQRILNATVNRVTKVSPSQLLYGNMVTLDRKLFKSYKLKDSKTVDSYLNELIQMQEKLLKASQRYLARSKDKKLANVDKTIDPIRYKVGDYVLVSHPDNKLPSKLDTKWYGPMQVVKVNRSQYYLIDLVTNSIIDRHISYLKPFRFNSDKITPFEVAIRDNQEYIVEKIIAHRLVNDYSGDKNRTSYEFKVRWLGYKDSDDTWIPWKSVSKLAALNSYLSKNQEFSKLIRVKVDEEVEEQ